MSGYKITKKKITDTEALFEITIPKTEVKKAEDKALENLRRQLVLPGFRKGNVPADVARKNISKSKLVEETARILFSDIFVDIVKKNDLKPFVDPIIEDLKIDEKKGWSFKLTIILQPDVKLPDYKKIIQDLKTSMKKEDIWIPGKSQDKDSKIKKEEMLNKILKALLDKTKLKISDRFIENEVKKRIADLVDDVRQAGMKFEEYLKTKNTTPDKLKESYRKQLIEAYKIELTLIKIADKENITVDEQEIKKLMKINTPEKEEKMRPFLYQYAASLRKQKTLEFLLSI